MRAGAAVAVVALTLVAAAGGFAAGRATAPEGRDETHAEDRPAAPAPAPERERPTTPRARVVVDEPATPPAPQAAVPPEILLTPDDGGATVTAQIRAPAAEDVLRARVQAITGGEVAAVHGADAAARARRIRSNALATAEYADGHAVREVAEQVVRERAFLADSARGGTLQLLRKLERGTRLFGLVRDAEAFGEHFTRRESRPTLDGATLPRETAGRLAHGTTLQFPAGTYAWDVSVFRQAREFPRDLVVAGAGMDATLIRVNELDVSADVTNLTFRDCTIDCGEDYLTELRTDHPITLRLERCRVVGFDMGAGGSVMLAAERAAFYATDCRFEAGYADSPGSGNLFRVPVLLVRCERCVFRGPFSSVWDGGAGATSVFTDCVFERQRPGFEKTIEAPGDGVRLERCVVRDPTSADERELRRPLSDFNPSWPSKPR